MRHLAFAVALAACSTSATRVHLDLDADASWGLDHYQLQLGTHSALAEPLPALDVELPDDTAGEPLTVEVWGLAVGHQVAYGTATVTPALHQTVSADVVLAAMSCGLWCNAGTVECGDDGTSTAACTQQPNGCLAWSSTTPCPSAAPYCSNGACAAQCTDECTVGQTECDSAVAVRMCEPTTGNACLHWSAPTACTVDQTCTNGACGTAATCATDGAHCDDGNACTTGDTCEGGTCSGTPKCTAAPANADPTCATDGTCGFVCHPGYMPSGTSCVPKLSVMFMSKASFTGNLGGLAGADAKCQAAATAAGLPGTFMAWLSDDTADAKTRLAHSPNAYVEVDQTVVAANWTQLTSNVLAHQPLEDEHGTKHVTDDTGAWTGTQGDGTVAPGGGETWDCSRWTSSVDQGDNDNDAYDGATGDADNPPGEAWTYNGGADCSYTLHLYCIEQ